MIRLKTSKKREVGLNTSLSFFFKIPTRSSHSLLFSHFSFDYASKPVTDDFIEWIKNLDHPLSSRMVASSSELI